MLEQNDKASLDHARKIVYKTKGHQQGPITRLVSPGDLGQVIKPFVFLDTFTVDPSLSGQMGYHPHSGIVTVTTIFEGSITYADSTGKSGVLPTGSVEWMQAGSGVWHTGDAAPDNDTQIVGVQLWLALPPSLENTPPESLYIDPENIPSVGPARVIIGQYQGENSPLPHVGPITYLHVHLKDQEEWTFDAPIEHDVAWIAVDKGALRVAGDEIASEVAVFDANPQGFTVRAVGETNFVLGSSSKHPYPLVTGAYSVHTTPEALKKGEEGILAIGRRMRADGLI